MCLYLIICCCFFLFFSVVHSCTYNPGGRFLEFYYWDSYWIILGLLHSEMQNTAKGMLLNFFSVIDRYGFIPNGGRIYYLTRSHPPMLSRYSNNVEKRPSHCLSVSKIPFNGRMDWASAHTFFSCPLPSLIALHFGKQQMKNEFFVVSVSRKHGESVY